MSEVRISRFRFVMAIGVAVFGGVLATGCAQAYQGHMENAIAYLNQAADELSQASPNKGGHKEAAQALIQQAINEVNAGIAFSNGNGPPVANYNGPPANYNGPNN